MTKPKTAAKKKTYVPAPQVSEELAPRYRAVLEVLSGTTTVSEAARRLSMSRNHFQTLMHRALASMIEGLTPQPPGRPPKPEALTQAEQETVRLRQENARLKERVETIDRLLGVAGDLVRGRTSPRATRRRTSTKTASSDDDEERPPAEVAQRLRGCGLRNREIARVMQLGTTTVERLLRNPDDKRVGRRSRERPLDPSLVLAAEEHVRAVRGLIGAEALARAIPGISRRQAARIRGQTLTEMERERVSRSRSVCVTAPGVMRGFDAMHVRIGNDVRHLLVAADASVPFRTTIATAERYDGDAVAATLEDDFIRNGAPLVLRMDRASVHKTPAVRDVCARHGVLVLHGPPRLARYYGQLERQNREHRAWLRRAASLTVPSLPAEASDMQHALNALVPRRSLSWRTSEACWNERAVAPIERATLLHDVRAKARSILASSDHTAAANDLAWRLAIESTLIKHGLLTIKPGRRC